ncbi:hypothetical protein M885DRAFT_247459 [Pelagophyceae sp. CCMP2097]|nr:hypothetical protein M885DRAFT_247459 [Pelagophyceae sp. CCMP2097]|mmetsp:Transcript_17755/g.61322  ORF Transcript_17755/g.61322 Transcript_17755/m.61322 type:complete len:228 (+) Transcript_17755:535-1218(+)
MAKVGLLYSQKLYSQKGLAAETERHFDDEWAVKSTKRTEDARKWPREKPDGSLDDRGYEYGYQIWLTPFRASPRDYCAIGYGGKFQRDARVVDEQDVDEQRTSRGSSPASSPTPAQSSPYRRQSQTEARRTQLQSRNASSTSPRSSSKPRPAPGPRPRHKRRPGGRRGLRPGGARRRWMVVLHRDEGRFFSSYALHRGSSRRGPASAAASSTAAGPWRSGLPVTPCG